PDEQPDDPLAGVGPPSPDRDAEQQGDQAVEEHPAPSGKALGQGIDDAAGADAQQNGGDQERDGFGGPQRAFDNQDADHEGQHAAEQIDEEAAPIAGQEGIDDLHDAAGDHQPAEDQNGGEGGDERRSDGHRANHNEDDSQHEEPGPAMMRAQAFVVVRIGRIGLQVHVHGWTPERRFALVVDLHLRVNRRPARSARHFVGRTREPVCLAILSRLIYFLQRYRHTAFVLKHEAAPVQVLDGRDTRAFLTSDLVLRRDVDLVVFHANFGFNDTYESSMVLCGDHRAVAMKIDGASLVGAYRHH